MKRQRRKHESAAYHEAGHDRLAVNGPRWHFDDKSLADINEGDIRDLIQTGRTEGPTLEYKSEFYETNDRGNREFLQDVCMFAKASGGTILIGIPELRDDANQPSASAKESAEVRITGDIKYGDVLMRVFNIFKEVLLRLKSVLNRVGIKYL